MITIKKIILFKNQIELILSVIIRQMSEDKLLNLTKKRLIPKTKSCVFHHTQKKSADDAFNVSINMDCIERDTNNTYKRTGQWTSSSTLSKPLTKYELQDSSIRVQFTVFPKKDIHHTTDGDIENM